MRFPCNKFMQHFAEEPLGQVTASIPIQLLNISCVEWIVGIKNGHDFSTEVVLLAVVAIATR